MIHTTIDLLGALTLGIIAGFLGLLIYHILLAFVKAWSWHRWALKISKVYETKVVWKHIPISFLIMWWELQQNIKDWKASQDEINEWFEQRNVYWDSKKEKQ